MIKNVQLNNTKFENSFEIDEWEIETDSGFQPITHIHKTIPFKKYILKTDNYNLSCADDHLVMWLNENNMLEPKYVKDLIPNKDLIFSIAGLEIVRSIDILDEFENMYDCTIDSNEHTYYTNGILSHNTTIATLYILWYALFHEMKNICLLSYKEARSFRNYG